MHQLTKDPERLRVRGQDTASSPKRTLSTPELVRYLDYCSEMLSLIGKLAALYVQKFDDPVALAAVNEVEELTTSLSRKIWQKIMILNVILAENSCKSLTQQVVDFADENIGVALHGESSQRVDGIRHFFDPTQEVLIGL